jgi:hypothetical protein
MTKSNLQPVNIPVCHRCCRCLSVKMAVAWEFLGGTTKAVNSYRNYCSDCAIGRGFTPSDALRGRSLDEAGTLRKKSDRTQKRKYIKKVSA